jgi:thiol:disulfide interchange protein DsbG
MQQLGSSATPTIFYKDAGGNLQKMQGAPSAEVLSRILGPR